jgi:hypothetical protein
MGDIPFFFVLGAVCLAPDSLQLQQLKQAFDHGVFLVIPAPAPCCALKVICHAQVVATELVALIQNLQSSHSCSANARQPSQARSSPLQERYMELINQPTTCRGTRLSTTAR